MKLFRKVLRYWIAIASIFSFLGGWVILAHSPKPVQPQSNSVQPAAQPGLPALATLPPIQAYGSTSNNGLTFFSNNAQANAQVNTQSTSPMPLLRTRGS